MLFVEWTMQSKNIQYKISWPIHLPFPSSLDLKHMNKATTMKSSLHIVVYL